MELTNAIRCPACGYDLRARSSDRCPECGTDVAGIESRPSAIPWVHRRKIGRIRAYLATLLRLHGPTRWIAGEMARPVDARSARSFRWVNAAVLFAWALCVCLGLRALAGRDPMGLLKRADLFSMSNSTSVKAALVTDLALPWTVGFGQTLPIVVASLLFSACCTGLASLWFCPRQLGEPRRSRASWLSLYASALLIPLAFVLGLVALILMAGPTQSTAFVERWIGEQDAFEPRTLASLTLLSLILAGFALSIWNWTRLNGLLRATCEPRFVRTASSMVGFPIAAVLLMAACAVVVPWTSGYFTIMAWSLAQ
jgi:hypothetical protein